MREKLIELLTQVAVLGDYLDMRKVADHLIANGVILKDDTSCMQRIFSTESSLDIKRMISEWENKPVVFHEDRGESIIPIPQWEWIPVTERLPEEDVRVLVWVGANSCNFPVIDTDRIHNGRWVRWDEYITNWMPLPEPPKGETNEN